MTAVYTVTACGSQHAAWGKANGTCDCECKSAVMFVQNGLTSAEIYCILFQLQPLAPSFPVPAITILNGPPTLDVQAPWLEISPTLKSRVT